jgi:hypothetical protein
MRSELSWSRSLFASALNWCSFMLFGSFVRRLLRLSLPITPAGGPICDIPVGSRSQLWPLQPMISRPTRRAQPARHPVQYGLLATCQHYRVAKALPSNCVRQTRPPTDIDRLEGPTRTFLKTNLFLLQAHFGEGGLLCLVCDSIVDLKERCPGTQRACPRSAPARRQASQAGRRAPGDGVNH